MSPSGRTACVHIIDTFVLYFWEHGWSHCSHCCWYLYTQYTEDYNLRYTDMKQCQDKSMFIVNPTICTQVYSGTKYHPPGSKVRTIEMKMKKYTYARNKTMPHYVTVHIMSIFLQCFKKNLLLLVSGQHWHHNNHQC